MTAPTDEPTILSGLMELEEAAFQRGLAVARGDDVTARLYHRAGLDAIGRILDLAGETPAAVSPRLNAVSE